MGLRIVMLGAPGAGKGTQAERIASDWDLPHISTGDIFRKNLKEGTELGIQAKKYMDAGELVPDDVTCTMVAGRLAESDCAEGYILDGFPRSTGQAEALTRLLAERGEGLDIAINISVPDEEIVDRLSARRFCPECGAIFNMKFNPPKGEPNTCDRPGCNGTLVQRDDDKPETIRQRLTVYHEQTQPIEQYYDQRGILTAVNGSHRTPDDIYNDIKTILTQTESGSRT